MNTVTLDIPWGANITHTCETAVVMANQDRVIVTFEFNGVTVEVKPGDLVDSVVKRWNADLKQAHQALVNSPEYKERQRKQAEKDAAARAAPMKELGTSEAELRDTTSPWPLTRVQLHEYIDSLVDREHEYGTCVYAMSLAAVAAFNYVAGQLGTTGFQSSCADLDILRRTRHMEGPFILLKGSDMLFPQYDLRQTLGKAMKEWQPWLAEQAKKKLAETDLAHPDVVAHWKKLTE